MQRQPINNMIMYSIGGIAALVVFMYVSANLFLLLTHKDMTAGPFTIFTLWRDHFYGPLRGDLVASLLLPPIVIGFIAYLIFGQKKPYYGNDHFATFLDIKKSGLLQPSGVLLGKYKNHVVCADGQFGMLVYAPPRSGKTTSITIPNLLNFRGSILINDIRLEAYKLTSGWRALHSEVFVLNPLDPERRTNRFNAIDFISTDKNLRTSDLQKITHILLPDPDRGEKIWATSGRDLLEGVILFLLDVRGKASIGEALVLIKSESKFVSFIDSSLKQHFNRLDQHTILAFRSFKQKAPKEQSGVLSTITSGLSLWSNPLVDFATRTSDFDPSDLRRKRMTIYVGLPPKDIVRLTPYLNLFFQFTFDALLAKIPGADEKHQVLALLDEFTSLGRLTNVERGLGYFAGYNIIMAPIIQDIHQLNVVYGKDSAEVFVSTSKYRIAYAQNDLMTAESISKSLGHNTVTMRTKSRRASLKSGDMSVNESYIQRPLMTPTDILKLPPEKEIIFVEGRPPILCEKLRYFNNPELLRRSLMPEYVVSPLVFSHHATSTLTPDNTEDDRSETVVPNMQEIETMIEEYYDKQYQVN